MNILASARECNVVGDESPVLDGMVCSKAVGVTRGGTTFAAYFEVPDGEPADVNRHLRFVVTDDEGGVDSMSFPARIAVHGSGIGVALTGKVKDMHLEVGDMVSLTIRKLPKPGNGDEEEEDE